MDNKDSLSDERLVYLHQQKRLNATFILYNRYENYGCAIILQILLQANLTNALKDEKYAILYDAITEAINSYDENRGSFRHFVSSIIRNTAAGCVRDFKKDPLSDYVSLDANISEGSNLRFADSISFAAKEATPGEIIDLDDHERRVVINYGGTYKRRIKKIIELREEGYTYEEIAKRYHMSAKAIRAIFYRIKKRIKIKNSSKIKK